jgi:hypothetical protein
MMGGNPKHVEQFPDISKLCNVASSWIYIGILLGAHYILHISRIRVNVGFKVVSLGEAHFPVKSSLLCLFEVSLSAGFRIPCLLIVLYSYVFMMSCFIVRRVCGPKFCICLARLYSVPHFRTRAERMK